MHETKIIILSSILIMATLSASIAIFVFNPLGGAHASKTQKYTYRVVETYPHDPNAFTQGLAFEGGYLYEGTGLYGRSSLRQVELETGAVLRTNKLGDNFFGEGITVFEDRIIQLTWRSNIGFVYGMGNFTLLEEFSYSTEGWGITHDGNRLIMSDGTSTLYFLDPETYALLDQLEVFDEGGKVSKLNELEYINGEVYANIWQTDLIARISPLTGQVVGLIDLAGLSELLGTQPVDVLNGIAYDSNGGRLFVTGKLWPYLFQIEIEPKE